MADELYGLYRGIVANDRDPDQLGRLQVRVPQVSDDYQAWALPCVGYGGDDDIGILCLPPIGADIWVMFEEGASAHPVWMGTYWSPNNSPPQVTQSSSKIFKTHGATVELVDDPYNPKLTITLVNGVMLTMHAGGMELQNGSGASIRMEGPKVSINNGALEII